MEAAVRLSSLTDYRDFERAFGGGRLEEARDCLMRCLRLPEVGSDAATQAYLEQTLGSVLFALGDEAGALERFHAGASTDPMSPLATLHLAKFLALSLRRYRDSLEWCVRSRERLEHTTQRAGTISTASLAGWITALEARCHASLREFSEARSRLQLLLDREQYDPEHTVAVCQMLLDDPDSQEIVDRYLRELLARSESSDEDLSQLSAQIRRMLKKNVGG
jgi:tetratricopeptide (TPR) repeat protein